MEPLAGWGQSPVSAHGVLVSITSARNRGLQSGYPVKFPGTPLRTLRLKFPGAVDLGVEEKDDRLLRKLGQGAFSILARGGCWPHAPCSGRRAEPATPHNEGHPSRLWNEHR